MFAPSRYVDSMDILYQSDDSDILLIIFFYLLYLHWQILGKIKKRNHVDPDIDSNVSEQL